MLKKRENLWLPDVNSGPHQANHNNQLMHFADFSNKQTNRD